LPKEIHYDPSPVECVSDSELFYLIFRFADEIRNFYRLSMKQKFYV